MLIDFRNIMMVLVIPYGLDGSLFEMSMIIFIILYAFIIFACNVILL